LEKIFFIKKCSKCSKNVIDNGRQICSNFRQAYFAAYIMPSRDLYAPKESTPWQMKTLENQAKNVPNVHITMGRRSKATTARINNLEKVKHAQQPSVEDVEEDE